MTATLEQTAQKLGMVGVCRYIIAYQPGQKGGDWSVYEQDGWGHHTVSINAFLFVTDTFEAACRMVIHMTAEERNRHAEY
jgi:hypothetical protein